MAEEGYNVAVKEFRQRLKNKGKKKKKKKGQEPTTILFWRQITKNPKKAAKLQNIWNESDSKQIRLVKPGEIIRPDNPESSISPGNPGQSIGPGNSGQSIGPGNPGQNILSDIPNKSIHSSNPGQSIRPGNPDQSICPDKPNQLIRPRKPVQAVHPANPNQATMRPANPGQVIRPRNPNQTMRPAIPGQVIRPRNPNQTMRPANTGQAIRPGNPGQSIRPGISGQQLRPDVSNQPSNAKKFEKSKKSKPANLAEPKQPIVKPSEGSKFKPIQELGKPLDIFSNDPNPTDVHPPKPSGGQLSLSQVSDSPVITIVGKNPKPRPNTVNQQKKILKFQMRIHSLQQEKKKQMNEAKMIQSMNSNNEMGTPITFMNPNLGMLNPEGMQNFVHMQFPSGVPNPEGVHTMPNMTNVSGMPNPLLPNVVYNTGMPNILGMPNQPGMINYTGIPNQPVPPVSVYQNQMNPMSVPITPVPQPEVVETVFHMEHDLATITQPINQNPTNPSKPQKSPKKASGRHYVDPYGFKYPKGIPKSFLMQQQNPTQPMAPDAPIWPTFPSAAAQHPTNKAPSPLVVLTDSQGDIPQPYSPSELYNDLEQSLSQDYYEDTESPEPSQSGQKRLSAFRRLGPQTQPKKPKMTISVTVNDDQEVREVVDETEELEEITPVHLREDMMLSTDETVMKYLKAWPWKRNVVIRKSVTARNSKTVMMLEREQMEEIYDKETLFMQVTVKGYPSSWKKENVLDTLMEHIRGYSFIPCFIEFNREECKFLTLRCRSALLSLHKCGFIIRKDNVELTITIAQTELTLNQLDFVPRLVLRKRLIMCADNDTKLNLSAFTLQEDVSHFIYFPLNRSNNQMEIIQMQNEVSWEYLTDLNLSHNRIYSLDGFDLELTAPKLKHLDLSYNCLDKVTLLLKCRKLPLQTIRLEGNPLCTNYTDPDQYVKVLRMMFSSLSEIDGIPVQLKGEMPKYIRNYCPSEAKELVEKFLEVYFPLLEGDIEHRTALQNMYEDDANLTITYNYKLAFGPIYRCFKSLFINARQLDEDKMYMIKGSMAIVKTIASWPHMEHDPFTFTVDVVFHSDTTTIIRVDGMLKLTRESLAEDEHLLSFSRTLVLYSRDCVEYKIQAEMVYWSVPTGDYARSAFSAVKTKQMYPKIDSTTDEELQEELLKIFMKLTTMNKNVSERCLELKKWNIKEALDHFTKLLKLDSLESLMKEVS